MLENARKKHQTTWPGGVSIRYSPVNQAYFVMWHDQVLRLFNRREEAERYANEITEKKMQQNPHRRLSKRCQRIVSRTAAQEIRAGYPQKQAVAIGYSKARKAGCRVPPPRRLEENPVLFWNRFSI
jgi:hypothetical protein